MMEWVARPDLNWCYYCWFGANIESKQTPIGVMYMCHNCGTTTRETFEDEPKHFTDEEWNKYWSENIKIKEQK